MFTVLVPPPRVSPPLTLVSPKLPAVPPLMVSSRVPPLLMLRGPVKAIVPGVPLAPGRSVPPLAMVELGLVTAPTPWSVPPLMVRAFAFNDPFTVVIPADWV